MKANQIKKGMKVNANRTFIFGGNDRIEKGKTYTVTRIDGNYVSSKECPFPYPVDYFDAIVKRDARGRFVSASNVTQSQTFSKPVTLKKGSLYGIKRKNGRVVARLRSTAPVGQNKTYAVFTRHNGRPFLASLNKITLANQEEVNDYLIGR